MIFPTSRLVGYVIVPWRASDFCRMMSFVTFLIAVVFFVNATCPKKPNMTHIQTQRGQWQNDRDQTNHQFPVAFRIRKAFSQKMPLEASRVSGLGLGLQILKNICIQATNFGTVPGCSSRFISHKFIYLKKIWLKY